MRGGAGRAEEGCRASAEGAARARAAMMQAGVGFLCMLRAEALTKSYSSGGRELIVLHGITFELEPGGFLAIVGPSGSGKSTLLGMLAGLDWPTSGEILLDGVDITKLSEDDMAVLRGRKLGFVALANTAEAVRIMLHQILIHQHAQHGLLMIILEECFSWLTGSLQYRILFEKIRGNLFKKDRGLLGYLLTQLMQFFITRCLQVTSLLFQKLPFVLGKVFSFSFFLRSLFLFLGEKLRVGVVLFDRSAEKPRDVFYFSFILLSLQQVNFF
jgi:energy-coupling factor transporter ATP-binding protein EcfA2